MSHLFRYALYLVVAAVFSASTAFALPMGTNITISDRVYSGTGWYGNHEDQEVEPNCVTGQYWDMEGFFLDGYVLSMVGGYDMVNGRDGFTSGDIFIDINGDATYGPGTGGGSGNTTVARTFGYDYVLALDFQTMTYEVFALVDGVTTVNVFYAQNDESNPWLYNDGGISVGYSDITYYSNLTDAQVGNGLVGGLHNVARFDLSFLSFDPNFTGTFLAHYTMECGNDNLMGKGTAPVPEPATLLLLGTGLLGLAGFRKKNS